MFLKSQRKCRKSSSNWSWKIYVCTIRVAGNTKDKSYNRLQHVDVVVAMGVVVVVGVVVVGVVVVVVGVVVLRIPFAYSRGHKKGEPQCVYA